MSYYIACFKKYSEFEGRARRAEYWTFWFINSCITLGLRLLGMASPIFIVILAIYALIILIPSLAVLVRRLHDTGRSGLWILISLVPIIGGIWLFVLTVIDSHEGSNEYGQCPKYI